MGQYMQTAITLVKPNQSASPYTSHESEITGMFDYIAGQLTESTVAMYKLAFRDYLVYAQDNGYSPVEHATLERWRDSMIFQSTKSPNTINRMIASIKRVMKEARKHGLITRDEAYDFAEVSGASMKRLKDRIKQEKSIPLMKAQMQELCNLPDESTLLGMRDKALLYTLAASGVRASELAGLLVSRIFKGEDGYFLQVMGKRDTGFRDAPLTPEAYLLIRLWVAERGVSSPYVFTSFQDFGKTPTNGKLSPKAIWDIVKEYAKQIEGMEHLSPHSFRHYMLQYVIKRSGIEVARIAAGHASIATTQLYDTHKLTVGSTDGLL